MRDEVDTAKVSSSSSTTVWLTVEEFSVLVSDDDALGNTKTLMYVVCCGNLWLKSNGC